MYLRSYAPVLDAHRESWSLELRDVFDTKDVHIAQCSMNTETGALEIIQESKGIAKWLHHGFSSSAILYNSWFAERHIRDSRIAVITEGPKDVWWLEQHGIHNSLCIFGLSISQLPFETINRYGCF
jgi:hypothetical protein